MDQKRLTPRTRMRIIAFDFRTQVDLPSFWSSSAVGPFSSRLENYK
jgi:hypothetical protein